MNIALFGGSFNPIHLGHTKFINTIAKNFIIQKFIVMPTSVSPHKSNNEMVQDFHRYKMCKLACEDIDFVEVSDWEIKRKEKSYTYITINYLKEIYPEDNLYLIVGADMFMSFESWKNFSDILKKVSLISVPRDDVSFEEMKKYSLKLEKYGNRCYILQNTVMDVSSSEIRYKIKNNIDVSKLLDEKVFKYIKDNQLYGCDSFE